MLRRQRTTLAVLSAAQQTLTATRLFKLMFLLGQETFVGRDPTFYEFVPYQYGPYSFALNRELETLTAYGYAKAEQAGSATSYTITELGAKEAKLVGSDAAYERAILPKRIAEIGKVSEVMRRTPAALLCMEKDPRDCHRSRLAEVLAQTSGLSVIHL